jgi:hypothetical protein
MLRNVSGKKKEEVTEGWRKLNNGELRSLYYLSNYNRMDSTVLYDVTPSSTVDVY